MNIKHLLTALFFTITSVVLAQNPSIVWQQTIGGSGNEGLQRVENPLSNEYFLIGTSDSDISGDKTENSRGLSDVWIVKMDVNNNILWDKTIGGDQSEWIEDVQVFNDQLFILCRSNSSVSGEKTIAPFSGLGSSDIWLICCDLSGTILWQNQYGGDQPESLSKMLMLPNNNVLLGITSMSGISGNKTENAIGSDDVWTVEISTTNGTIINQNTIGSVNEERFKNMLLTTTGSIMLLCQSEEGISGDKTDNGYGFSDVWMVEIDTGLNVLQDKCFGGDGLEDSFGGNFIYENGYFYVCVSSSSDPSGNKTADYQGSFDLFERNDYWVLKLDENLNIIWDKSYGGLADDIAGGIITHPWNKFIIMGSSESNIGGNKTSPKYGGSDMWMLILNEDGDIIAQESYGGSAVDGGAVYPIPQTNARLYYSGGSDSGVSGIKTVGTNGGYDNWSMELDASNFLNTEEIQGAPTTISVYPNPTIDDVNFKFSQLEEDVVVDFYSIEGQLIDSKHVPSGSSIINFELNFPRQMLVYKINGDSIHYSGKLILD